MDLHSIPIPVDDLSGISTPCHIIDLDRLQDNLSKVEQLKAESGCNVLLAAKGFSSPYFFSFMRGAVDGISASGLYEARIGRECYGEYVQTYSPGFRDNVIEQILACSNAIVFNSKTQLNAYLSLARLKGCSCGIRINPMFSRIKKKDVNPCGAYSRLGIPYTEVTDALLDQVDGILIHSMCEQQADALEELIDFIIHTMGKVIDGTRKLKWINLGGGQLIGSKQYDVHRAAQAIQKLKNRVGLQILIEPCEGIVTETGYLATSVCDIVYNRKWTAIIDSSPVCHLPDAVFRGWRHDICGELPQGEDGYNYYISGPTCFPGDTYGEYTFRDRLHVGDILFLKDTAAYSIVKSNSFNGVPFPDIYTYSRAGGLNSVKRHSYDSYLQNL